MYEWQIASLPAEAQHLARAINALQHAQTCVGACEAVYADQFACPHGNLYGLLMPLYRAIAPYLTDRLFVQAAGFAKSDL